jgi:DNA-binding CsgD family transcriptional regulator
VYAAKNPWLAAAPHRFVPGQILDGAEILDPAELRRTEFYAGFMRPQGYEHTLGNVVAHTNEALANVALARGPREYEAGDRRLLRYLDPHLRRAVELSQVVRGAYGLVGTLTARLEHLRIAVFSIARDGSASAKNDIADSLLSSGDSGIALDRRGRLRLCGPIADRELQTRVRSMMAHEPPSAGERILVERTDRAPLLVDAAPIRGLGSHYKGGVGVVFVRQASTATPIDPEALQRAFGLTPAETEVAQSLARGAAVAEIAAELGVSRETIRTHVKRLLAKTGTSRQAQLCLLLATFS